MQIEPGRKFEIYWRVLSATSPIQALFSMIHEDKIFTLNIECLSSLSLLLSFFGQVMSPHRNDKFL